MPRVAGVQLGIVGKPNTGKTTFFVAATLQDARIAPYPFTTIEPNVGIGYVRFRCVCREFGVKDEPVNSACVNGWRFAPIELIDVAGLVPDAWRGRGLGNRFLDHLRRADALIHVIDASGSTDIEGRPVEPGSHDPLEDVKFLEREIDMWIYGMLEKDWRRFALTVEATGAKIEVELYKRLSGLEVREEDVAEAVGAAGLYGKRPTSWSSEDLLSFVRELRRRAKPMVIAANKADLPTARRNIERLREELKGRYVVIPTSAEAELALRRASAAGLIRYLPGDSDFEVTGKLNERQERALEYIRRRVLKVWGSTGVQEVLNTLVFDVLGYVAVFPVADEQKLSDSKGRVLPEVYLMRRGSTARDLAYAIHTELGEKFIAAVDVRTRRRLGADAPLEHRSVIRIVAGR
ncbi:MAG: redox-regulated ATPase YchF [Thermoprotei archaeon]|nr:MAG: redox-regulated ATPase YchF [Thermoprotei archaeon]RLE98311.1 MAG: redox-regulated ATPase YchF [Thermoprotei archaeon]